MLPAGAWEVRGVQGHLMHVRVDGTNGSAAVSLSLPYCKRAESADGCLPIDGSQKPVSTAQVGNHCAKDVVRKEEGSHEPNDWSSVHNFFPDSDGAI